jgi:hypothetical protein
MRSYGPRFDPDGIVQHARVAQATTYELATILWCRRLAGGEIRCELLRGATGPARRIVQLVAEYEDAGEPCTRVRRCESPAEETEGAAYLERMIIEASRRAAPAEMKPSPSAP